MGFLLHGDCILKRLHLSLKRIILLHYAVVLWLCYVEHKQWISRSDWSDLNAYSVQRQLVHSIDLGKTTTNINIHISQFLSCSTSKELKQLGEGRDLMTSLYWWWGLCFACWFVCLKCVTNLSLIFCQYSNHKFPFWSAVQLKQHFVLVPRQTGVSCAPYTIDLFVTEGFCRYGLSRNCMTDLY